MAIYHLHLKIIQRSKGKNVVASAAYRRAAKLFDEKEQKTWNYTHKKDVIHSEMIVPENAPHWAKALLDVQYSKSHKAAEQLWNKVEAVEKRIDSQLAREIEFSLPIELDEMQNIQLAREFIHDQFVLRGMIADWNLHWDAGNPHVHVLLTMRTLTEEGFGKRALEWNSKALLQEWREKWSEYANFHLRLHQQDVRIDHRSYQDQGIHLIPSTHQGKAVTDMDRRGIATGVMQEANTVRRENLARISADPNTLLDKISNQHETFTAQQLGQELGRYINDTARFSVQEKGRLVAGSVLQEIKSFDDVIHSSAALTPDTIAVILKSIEYHESVFSERELAKAISPFTQNAESFAKALMQIKTSNELIHLGAGEDGRDRFTTRRMFDLENSLQKVADNLRDTSHIKISSKHIQVILKRHQNKTGKQLTDEQATAVKHILRPCSISCLVGRAGTGKSFSLGAAKAVWESRGFRVQGIALSGIAADGLNKDADIASRTIESFRYAIEKGQLSLNHHDVIVMDEAGMTDSVSMMAVLNSVQIAKAKLVLVGDHAQIQPVGPGASFRALLERLGFAEIHTVYRQKEQWQREATVAFSAGKVVDGLTLYEQKNCIHHEKNAKDAMKQLVQDWSRARELTSKEMGQYLVIAHRNEDVSSLNQLLRTERIARQEIAEGHAVNTKRGQIYIAQDDRLLFLKNDKRLGVNNGRFATIKNVNFTESGQVLGFTVLLDGTGQEVHINPNEYNDFTYGYSATVHKVQGMTVDHAFVYAGGLGWDRHLSYVAVSRHRETCHIYADQDAYSDIALFKKRLGRLGMKDSLLDFPLAFAERRSIDVSGILKRLPKQLAERLTIWKEKIAEKYESLLDPERSIHRRFITLQEKLTAIKTSARREDARVVAAYVDANREVGKAWQVLQAKLHGFGLDVLSYGHEEFHLISATKEYQAFQNVMYQRNAIAFKVTQDVVRYQKAIEIYELDVEKLKNQANKHECHARVKEYQIYYQKGAVVLRDRVAARICCDIKNHYFSLQSFGLKTAEVKMQGMQHLKRQLFKTLSMEERETFRSVKTYQEVTKKAGHIWAEIKKEENTSSVKREKRIQFKKLVSQRNELAYQIMKERSCYEKALQFYQIGTATSHFNMSNTERGSLQAQARLEKLQQSAMRYEEKNVSFLMKDLKLYANEMLQQKDVAVLLSQPRQEKTLQAILMTYVDLELEQTRLVNEMHSARLKNPQQSKEHSSQVISHRKKIQAFARDAINHSDVKLELEQLKDTKPMSLAKRGGFKAILERLQKCKIEKEDVQVLVAQLRWKALDETRSRTQERDRGGRSR